MKKNVNSNAVLQKVARAEARRQALRRGDVLWREARRLLEAVDRECEVLLAYSREGEVVASAAAALAAADGHAVAVFVADHSAPADGGPGGRWTFAVVEEVLGWAPARHWALEWAAARGGGGRYAPVLGDRAA